MSERDLFLPAPLRDEIAAYLEPRASAIDAGTLDVREGLAFVQRHACDGSTDRPNADPERIARTIATVAWSDLASAFSLWCHRMVLEYFALAPADAPARADLLPRLLDMDLIGSTGLAPAMAHVVSGAALPITARSRDGTLVLDGRVPWASNLFAPDFVLVTAAAADDGDRVVVLTSGLDGLRIAPCPELLALQGTASSSVVLEDVVIPADRLLPWDLADLVRRVRPAFLMLQSAFCWGLARRALDEASRTIGAGDVLCADLAQLEHCAGEVAGTVATAASRDASGQLRTRELVALRLEAQSLATRAVALELRASGSRAYLRASPTARRLREAAFLPIQAPTEKQLRTELSDIQDRERGHASPWPLSL